MVISVLDRAENIVGKGENAGNNIHAGKGENAGFQHFLLFPQCFQKLSFQEVLKVGTELKHLQSDNIEFLTGFCIYLLV